MSPKDSSSIPEAAVDSIRQFVQVFLSDFVEVPFRSTKLCWYTDSLDNSFVVRNGTRNVRHTFSANIEKIDHVPTYADNSLFVCTGGSGHGAKFLPVLGKVNLLSTLAEILCCANNTLLARRGHSRERRPGNEFFASLLALAT